MITTRQHLTRRFRIRRIDGRFYLTGPRGAVYVATPAFVSDDDTMKLVGGRWGAQVLRDRRGGDFHVSRRVLEEHAVDEGRYAVKCDDCKAEIRRTDSLAESAQGGRCATHQADV